jgi:molybdopterin-binding protein
MAGRRTERLVAAGEAARALGISLDTLRRWDKDGRLRVERDARGRRQVPVSELERLTGRAPRPLTGARLSARNRMPGVVRSVVADGVMALVEVEAGPFTIVAAITRDAVEELALAEGVPVVATVKATSVMVSREGETHRA